MNTRRKEKKAKELGDYYYCKLNSTLQTDLKGIVQYERAISFKEGRMRYSEDVLHNLSKLYYYSGYHDKALRTIQRCLEYSCGYEKALLLKVEILEGMGKGKEAKIARQDYDIQLKKSENQILDLNSYYGKQIF